LAYFGHFGHPGIGYRCDELVANIRRILGTDRDWPVALIGTGNLGRALLGYRGFTHQGFRIVAAFDTDHEKVGANIDGVRIYHLDDLPQQVAASREAAELARAVMWTYSQRLMIAPREREWVRREASMEKAATTLETVYQRYVEGGAPASAEKGREVPCAAPPRLEHER
jgi:FlaA1/EpsC-like NDP-sugar epimerase